MIQITLSAGGRDVPLGARFHGHRNFGRFIQFWLVDAADRPLTGIEMPMALFRQHAPLPRNYMPEDAEQAFAALWQEHLAAQMGKLWAGNEIEGHFRVAESQGRLAVEAVGPVDKPHTSNVVALPGTLGSRLTELRSAIQALARTNPALPVEPLVAQEIADLKRDALAALGPGQGIEDIPDLEPRKSVLSEALVVTARLDATVRTALDRAMEWPFMQAEG